MVDDREIQEIDKLVATAKKAQEQYEANGSQELFDLACQAVGWALMQPENNSELSKLAVSETGLGNVNDKIQKKTQRLNKIISKKLSAVSMTEGGSEAKVDPLALTGFITSLVGLFASPVLLGLLSIIFGAIGLSRINKNPEKYKGKGFGITALILGIIEVVVIFLLVALLLGAAI